MAKDSHARYCWRTGCRAHAEHFANQGYYCSDHIPFDWSEEKVAELRKLHGEGCSGSEIARRMGTTRNTIIGKLGRIGLMGKGTGRGKSHRAEQAHINNPQRAAKRNIGGLEAVNAVRKVERLARDAQRFGPEAIACSGPIAQSLNLQITDDGFGGCRWPTMGEGGETRFCCLPKMLGSYCADHARKAYVAVPATGRKSAAELARGLRRYA